MKKLLYLTAVAALLLQLNACGESKTKQESNPYIEACTGGVVSIDATIKVRLVAAFLPNDNANELIKGIFKISSSPEGDVFWEDATTICFKPAKYLKSGTEYKVVFDVSALYPEAKGKDKKFTFYFSTIAPSFTYTIQGLRLYDDTEVGDFYLQGELRPADRVENDKAEALLEAEVDGKKTNVRWEHANYYHTFTIDHITPGDKPYNVLLKWNGKPIGYDYKHTDTIVVPVKGDFHVLNVQLNQDNNSIDCYFSYALDAKQKYASYIEVGEIDKLRFTTTGNRLTIVLPFKPKQAQTLLIREGLKSKLGTTLAETYTERLSFEETKPEIRLLSKGVIMPNSSGLQLPFQAVSLKAVDVIIYRTYENNILQFLQVNNLDGERELRRVARPIAKKTIRLNTNKSLDLRQWNTFSIDLSSIIAPEPGAVYTVKIKFNKNYSLYSACPGSSADVEENYMTENIEDDLPNDNYYYDYDDYDYDYYSSDNPCSDYYYRGKRFVSQNILASNVGLIAKRGNDRNYLVYATSLVTAEPMSGVKIVFYNYQQQKIGEGSTGSNGIVQVVLKEAPYVLMGQDGVQKSYLRIIDEQSLSLSSFDVSGTSVNNGLKGFIYGERGVWRPGDTLFLTFVMEDRDKRLPDNHPVTFELYNVNNQLANKQVRTEGQNGFYTFAVPTDADDPTGNWNAYVKVGGVTFSKTLRVATVKPNRLKITTKLDHEPVLSGQAISGTVNAKWLHGAPTGGNEADIAVRFAAVRATFKAYQDYSFDDITKRFDGDYEKEQKGRLNGNGDMNFNIPVNRREETPGKMRAAIAVRVFEEGGEFSIDNFSVDVYPYDTYVGLKMPKGIGYYNRLETDKDQTFEVVSLDAAGKPVKRTLDVAVYRSEWSWWWFSSDGSLADYAYRVYHNEIYSTKIATNANGAGSFTYKLTYPEWGLFLVKVTDPQSGYSATQKMYIDWWGYGRGDDSNSAGASMLTFHTDKAKYNVGEKATVTVPSTAGAKLLVTVENGSRVLSSTPVDCNGDETKVAITTTAEMTPNAYIYVALLQPHQQTKNDLPMRLYGFIPLMVEDPAPRLSPEINAPDVIRPEQQFTVKVKESKGKDMTYTLAIVDEGLLDLTRFKTPDLWEHFFQREALGVRTWDLYNYVLGAYGGKIEQLFAIGGDDELSEKKGGDKAERFKPVVKFAGPFTLKGGKTNSHNFTINNYVGSVRVMLVAGNTQAYGNDEKTVPVRSPLMVQATLPRVLGPGEEVTLPATIFAMEKQVKDVKVELKLDDMFEPLNGTTQSLTFNETGDEIVRFQLKVKNKLGIARVKVVATSGSETAENIIEIDVRAANPPVIVSDEKIVSANQSAAFALKAPGMEGTNSMQLEVSSIPPINLGSRLAYLIAYPHGCLEQTTSCVFPQLYLGDVVDMVNSTKEVMKKNVEAALKRLTYFVKSDGSFSYWPGGGYGCEWTNNYAGHFLVEAENKGYKIPGNMKENWISYQQKAARNWSATTDDNRYEYNQNDLIQAYRLYVLALAKKQELGAMNRLKERSDLSIQAKWMLAGAYALAGQPEAGKKIIENLSIETKNKYNDCSNTYGSPDRDDAITLDILTLLGMKEKAFLVAQRISKAMGSDYWMSTQTTAYCLMGMSKFALSETSGLNFAYTVANGKAENVSSKKSLWNVDLGSKEGTVTLKFDNKANQTLFVRLTAKGVPAQGEEVASEKDLKLTVRYINDKGNTIDVTRLRQGTDFLAEVKIANPGQRGHYTNLALTQIFPSGWEITENRLEDENRNDGVTYSDIRDDRVLSYFDLRKGNAITVKVKLRAAYTGKFYLPAVACEAMYDDTIHANTTGQKVEVY